MPQNSDNSILSITSYGNNSLQHYELKVPYMIVYESIQSDNMTLINMLPYSSYTSREKLDDSSKNRPLHIHNFYEMTYVISGELHVQIEDEYLTFHEGDFYVYNKNIRHRELTDSNVEYVCFMYNEDFLVDLSQNDRLLKNGEFAVNESFIMRFLRDDSSKDYAASKKYISYTLNPSYNAKELNPIQQLINTIVQEMLNPKPGFVFLINGYFCRLFYTFENSNIYHEEIHNLPLSKEEFLFSNIVSIVEEKKGRVTRDEISKKLGYNSDYLNRVVKQHTGMTLGQYCRDSLLMEAEHMLIHTDYSISKICELLGYNNQTFFNRIFQEKYHTTPKTYRSLIHIN